MLPMQLEHVIALCRSFEGASLPCWVDGGWGVDALLGEQTRPHSDLDLAVLRDDLPAFQRVLEEQGFVRADRPGDPDWNWVLRHIDGSSVDLHSFVPDEQGNGILGDPANGEMYPVGALDGIGTLGGMKVRCISARAVLGFRNGFDPRAVDRHDVAALCSRFDLPLPSRFQTREMRPGK
jgi:lincosamide nucleotidyltransferase A/C/D/E